MKKGNLILVGLVASMILGTGLYDKAHKVRECKVIQENDNWVTVMHPNGEEYDFYDGRSTKFEYIEDTVIKVSFNELKLSERNYEVNAGNPIPVFSDIEDKSEDLVDIEDRTPVLVSIEDKSEDLVDIEDRTPVLDDIEDKTFVNIEYR